MIENYESVSLKKWTTDRKIQTKTIDYKSLGQYLSQGNSKQKPQNDKCIARFTYAARCVHHDAHSSIEQTQIQTKGNDCEREVGKTETDANN